MDGDVPGAALRVSYLQNVVSLAVAAIGGVLSIAGSLFPDLLKTIDIWIALGLIGIAAVLALSAQDLLIRGIERGLPSRVAPVMSGIASGALGCGIGFFCSLVGKAAGLEF